MTKRIKNMFLYILFTFIIYIFLSNPNIIILSMNSSVNTFINSLVPSLLPFLILTDILKNYGYFNFLDNIIRFKYSSFFIVSLISGLPANANLLRNYFKNNEISKEDAEKILSCSFFPGPMFVVGFVGTTLIKNTKIAFIMLLIIYASNLIMFLFYYKTLDASQKSVIIKKEPLFTCFKKSIISNSKVMLMILGCLSLFNILICVLGYYFNLNGNLLSIINGFLEISSGLKSISFSNINTYLKYVFMTVTLSFSGISVLSQAFSLLNEYELNILYIIKQKIIIALISLLLSLLTFYLLFQ